MRLLISCVPELWLAFHTFTLNFIWEMFQIPTYRGMAEMPHWQGVIVCTQATIGDVGFALLAFWISALVRRSRTWMQTPRFADLATFIGTGIVLTVIAEFYYVEIAHRWTYADWLPRLPVVGTGLSPLMQWLLLPPVVLMLSRRQMKPT